ncbi:MAG: hypothetical protein IJH68_12400 [Thermoguttaceae bacterium]|nr:hypothetical protein [Thermoguttaceae bacterium]
MKRRFFLTTGSLGILLGCCFLYAKLLVPVFIFPKPPARSVTQGAGPGPAEEVSGISEQYTDLLLPLFPDENDWRRNRPQMIVMGDSEGLFLFKGVPSISPNRREITLMACTIVVPSADEELSREERFRQALVIETFDRASIQFTTPITMEGLPPLSALDKGMLIGEVQIRSEMSGPEESFLLSTRDISFTQQQILANNEVFFRFGPHRCEGEGLRIEFAPLSDSSDNPYSALAREGNLGAGITVDWISLQKLNRLQFEVEGASLGNTFTAKEDRPVFTPVSAEEPISGAAAGKEEEKISIEVRCENGILFAPNPDNPAGWVGRFMENVEVVLFHKTEKEDRLTCQNLYLYLIDPDMERRLHELIRRTDIPRPKRMPSGRIQSLLPQVLKATRSDESQANVELASWRFSAFGDDIVYEIPTRRIRLCSENENEPVRLKLQDRASVQAANLDYTFGEDGGIGILVADKRGELIAQTDEAGGAPLEIRWQDGLRIDPDAAGENIKLSAYGGVHFHHPRFGDATASQADFWASLPPKGAPMKGTGLEQLRPRSIQLRGGVELVSGTSVCRLSEEMTIRLQEISFMTGSPNSLADLTISGGQNSRPDPGGGSAAIGPIFGGADNGRIQIDGGRLDLWVHYSMQGENLARNRASSNGQETASAVELAKMVIRHNVRLIQTDAGGKESLRIEGDEAKIDQPNSQNASADLVGRPAGFHGFGLDLAGYNVRFDQAENSLSVVGPGNLSILPDQKISSLVHSGGQAPGVGTQPISVTWSRHLVFNGQTLRFQGDAENLVAVRQQPSLSLDAPEILFTLQQPVRIIDLGRLANEKMELASVECLGTPTVPVSGVFRGAVATHQGATPADGLYRFELVNLRYENGTNRLRADGPGTLRLTRNEPLNASMLNSAIPGVGENQSGSAAPGAGKDWLHIHLVFSKQLEGALDSRTVTVTGRVMTAIAGSDSPDTVLNAADRGTFPEDTCLLTSDQQRVTVLTSPQGGADSVEVAALGNAALNWRTYSGRGEKLKYSDAKKTVIMEGDGLNKVLLSRRSSPGSPATTGKFSRLMINLQTQEINSEISGTTLSGDLFNQLGQ